MKLIIEPDAGAPPVLGGIRQAKKSIDILIFRLDHKEIIEALRTAVTRGVLVRALIASTNSGGEKNLRKLELRLLEAGVTVSRTADDLMRYHGKMMIVDNHVLHVYGFNFTSTDLAKTRSFGVITKNRRLILEAIKLFDADCARHPYAPGLDRFVVSPDNARDCLSAFIKGARKQLLIYDPHVSDRSMMRLLLERAHAGVDVRIIGKLDIGAIGKGEGGSSLTVQKYPGKRLHVRMMVRDGRRGFLGSQSLKKIELDRRREVGIIIEDPSVVKGLQTVFEQDWALTDMGKSAKEAHGDTTESQSLMTGQQEVGANMA